MSETITLGTCKCCGAEISGTATWTNEGGPFHPRCAQFFGPPERPSRTPHRCPLCNGSGRTHFQPMEGNAELWTDRCHGCNGTGIVWDPSA